MMIENKIDSGMLMMTTMSVDRQLPRKIRIMSAVSAGRDQAPRAARRRSSARTNTDWSNSTLTLR